MKRTIIEINEDKCNGCGLCVTACHEGAIAMVDGKAKIINEAYCDGLGACLPECPTDAIQLIEKDAPAFDETAAMQAKMAKKTPPTMACGCPGTMAKSIKKPQISSDPASQEDRNYNNASQLTQWPVQIQLINPQALYLENANLLIAADCTAYAYGNFHQDFIKGHICIIGCPKLDNNQENYEKIYAILMSNNIKSVTVVRMEVPCCNGIIEATKKAILDTKKILPYREVTISSDGCVIDAN